MSDEQGRVDLQLHRVDISDLLLRFMWCAIIVSHADVLNFWTSSSGQSIDILQSVAIETDEASMVLVNHHCLCCLLLLLLLAASILLSGACLSICISISLHLRPVGLTGTGSAPSLR